MTSAGGGAGVSDEEPPPDEPEPPSSMVPLISMCTMPPFLTWTGLPVVCFQFF